MSRKGHRVVENWMGTPVETLEDLLASGLRAVCVGINPSPTSVAAGHYYQGRLGQAFYERLRVVGLLPREPGWEDDLAFAHGIGFTDIVKRPTRSAAEVRSEEFSFGRGVLIPKIEDVRPQLLVFTFKKTAEKLFGKLEGCGLMQDLKLGGAPIFLMPGPYAPRALVEEKLEQLGGLLANA